MGRSHSAELRVISHSLNLTINELFRVSQNVNHSLIKINELSILHLELEAFIDPHERRDDVPASLFKPLEVMISMIHTWK